MTQEMYGASGKIGNKTYYRSNGKTVARDQGSFIDLESEYYLNNAGEGGAQGSSTPAAPESNDPTYNNTVSLNGVSQGVGGGSVSVTAPFTTAFISGTNLADSTMYAVKSGSETHIQPTSKTATAVTFSELDGAAGDTFTFYKASGQSWFVVSVSAPGGGGQSEDDEN